MTASWLCPFCNRYCTILPANVDADALRFNTRPPTVELCLETTIIHCPNPECRRWTLTLRLGTFSRHGGMPAPLVPSRTWRLIPESAAKVFPDIVPDAIRANYREACLVCELSPKSSATMSRRCIQGMIRDRYKISKRTLKQEIEAIRDKVDPEVWKGIDAVRRTGNIGAHMDQDVNVIVDVEPEEAERLIGLIELLIKEWYLVPAARKADLEQLAKLHPDKSETPPRDAPDGEAQA